MISLERDLQKDIKTSINVLLVEDHISFRQSLAFFLEAESDVRVVAEAGTIAETLEVITAPERIDVAVVDLGLPDGDGVELVRQLSERSINTIVLTASIDRSDFARAVEAGAAGVIHKTGAIDEIVGAVRSVQAGEALLSSAEIIEMLRIASKKRFATQEAENALAKLTARERQILGALSEGLDSKEIARKFHITIETERTHIVNILTKLGVHSRLQAVVFVARHGLIRF